MFAVKTCDELYHFMFSIDRLGIPLGSQPIKSTLARHSGVQVPVIFRLPTGLHGLCFGFCFASPLPLRSLTHGPLLRICFGESLVFRLYSEIDHIHLSSEAQCVSHHLPPGGLPHVSSLTPTRTNWLSSYSVMVIIYAMLKKSPTVYHVTNPYLPAKFGARSS